MKSYKLFFLLMILLVSFHIGLGQDKAKAELVDEFPNLSCDPLLARTDGFLSLLQSEPTATGCIVIYGEKGKQLENFFYEQILKGAVKIRQFDLNRVVFARAEDQSERRIQLWKIPAGGDEPVFVEGKWSYALSEIEKPFVFHKTFVDDICPPTDYLELYSRILSANPNFRGHLVISEPSAAKFRATERKILDELANDHKVSRSQIKSFFVKNKSMPDIEFWIVPRTKKQMVNEQSFIN